MTFNRWPEDQEGLRSGIRRVAVQKVDDSGKKQQLVDLTGLSGENLKKIVRILPHGFSSNPPSKSEGIIITLGGRSDRAMVLGLEDPQTRQYNLPEGTAILYDDKGNIIHMKGDKGVVVDVKKGDWAQTVEEGKYNVTVNQGAIAIVALQDKITIDAKQQSVTIQAENSTISILANGDITVDPGSGHNVYLGGPAGAGMSQVLTVAGASSNVWAKIG